MSSKMGLPPPPDISQSLRFFRSNRLYCDVRLRLDPSMEFLAHRVVLAASSPYFCINLKNVDGMQELWLPPDFPSDVMSFLLCWMYHESTKIEVCLNPDDNQFLLNLWKGAEALGILDLAKYAENLLKASGESVVKTEIEEEEEEEEETRPSFSEPEVEDVIDVFPGHDEVEKMIKVEKLETEKDATRTKESIKRKKKTIEGGKLDAKRKRNRKPHAQVYCEKCGKRCRKCDLVRHNIRYHSIVRTDLAQRFQNMPRDDPVLKEGMSNLGFQCVQCLFQISKPVNSKDNTQFYKQCAKHLYKQHKTVCPHVCFPCQVEGCKQVLYGRCNFDLHRLNKHIRKESVKKPKKPCDYCGLILVETSLKTHIMLKHGDKGKHPCLTCGKIFPNTMYLKTHETKVHATVRPYSCEECEDFSTHCKSTYFHHSYYRHGIVREGAKLYDCPSCTYKSPVERIMQKHIKDKHLSQPIIVKCKDCEKTFTSEQLMKSHFKRLHRGSDVSNCTICGAMFRSKSGLNYHQWRVHKMGKNGSVHDDKAFRLERPFKCAYCSHTSGLSGNVRKHVMNTHRGLPVRYVDLRQVTLNETFDVALSPSSSHESV